MEQLILHGEHALFLSFLVALPILAAAALIGVFVAALQAATQIQDPTLSHLPRLLGVAVALALLAPWMGHEIARFAAEMFRAAGV